MGAGEWGSSGRRAAGRGSGAEERKRRKACSMFNRMNGTCTHRLEDAVEAPLIQVVQEQRHAGRDAIHDSPRMRRQPEQACLHVLPEGLVTARA